MSGQLTISFELGQPAEPTSRREVPGAGRAATGPSPGPSPTARTATAPRACDVPALPEMQLAAGYEMYRDEVRTVIRKPGESRWGATVRTGPTTHRFVAAGEDPEDLWFRAGEATATAAGPPQA